jgi:hypothetical protein
VHELVKRTLAAGKIGNSESSMAQGHAHVNLQVLQSFPFILSGSLIPFMVPASIPLAKQLIMLSFPNEDYFRRWHRQKANSGGLMVHKSGHHFDLVNWWLDATPETVAAMGKLAFYGEENGKRYGWARKYERARGSEAAKGDPFAIHLEDDETLKSICADAEKEDGYYRDKNVSGTIS